VIRARCSLADFLRLHQRARAAAIFLRAAGVIVRFALTGFAGFDFALTAAHLSSVQPGSVGAYLFGSRAGAAVTCERNTGAARGCFPKVFPIIQNLGASHAKASPYITDVQIFGSRQNIGYRSAPVTGTFGKKVAQMVSARLRTRLERREAVLRILDRRRAQTGDPNLGWGMEKKILDLELADLETTMGIQESTERTGINCPFQATTQPCGSLGLD